MIDSVFGLDYVGMVSAVCLANRGHQVIGVKEALLRSPLERRLLTVTSDVVAAVHASDISLICVGTPNNPNGSLRIGQVAGAAEEIEMARLERMWEIGMARVEKELSRQKQAENFFDVYSFVLADSRVS